MLTIRNVFVALLAAIGACTLAAQGESGKGDPKFLVEDSAVRQAQLKRAYEDFRGKLALLAGRLEASSDSKDRDRGKALRAALKEASERGVEVKFDSLIRSLGKKDAERNIDLLAQVIRENKDLRDDLQKIIALLSGGDRQLAQKLADYTKLLDELKEHRDKQARMQARTETGKHDAKDLAGEQGKLTGKTKDTLDKLHKASSIPDEVKDAVKNPLESANAEQKSSENKLGKGDRAGAGDAQGRAVAKLDEAIRRLEDLVRQGRQEEQERKLADLLARAKRMLEAEKQILLGTTGLQRDIHKAGKADLGHAARSNKLAEQQMANLREAESALKVIRADGTAYAFEEVFDQVGKDMDAAQRRLARVEVDDITVSIEQDIVATLKDVVAALEKALQDIQNPDQPPLPPDLSGQPPLVSVLQQLKMVSALQRRVNARTELYGRRYPSEQVPEPRSEREKDGIEFVKKELRDLSGRQDRIARVTKELSRDNPRLGSKR